MCIITNDEHVVVSISLLPGLGNIPDSYHVYFPYKGELPNQGDYFNPKND